MLQYDDGILFVAENPSRALHKISEIYDRIAFAAVGKYNEFENLRIAGVRYADMRGYSYDRARRHRARPGQRLRADPGLDLHHASEAVRGRDRRRRGRRHPDADQIYRITYDGSVADEHGFVGDGWPGRAVDDGLKEHYAEGSTCPRRWRSPSALLGHDTHGDARELTADQLEVAVLDRTRPRRKFRRITGRPRTAAATATATRVRRPTPRPAGTRSRRTARGPRGLPTGPTSGTDREPSRAPPGPPMPRRHSVGPWTAASSGSRTSTASRARSGASAGCRPDEVARYLFRRVVSWGRSSNVFLRNGARLYLDVGSHPEYATPECDDFAELVAHDKAGERILEGLLVDAERRLREEGIAGDVYLFKNNTDSAGNSYGCHENYLVGRHGEFGRLADVLIPFLVTRQIICGAGKVLQTPRGAVYCRQPAGRAHLGGRVSRDHPVPADHQHPRRAARRRRALPPAARHRRRLEHDARPTTLLKVGATDLVLRMIEAGVVHARPHAGEPDPGDPRDQPRHHRPAQGAAGQRPRGQRAGDPARVLRPRPATSSTRRGSHADSSSRCSTCGSAR